MSDFYTVEPDGTVIATMQSGWVVECLPVGDLLLRVGDHIERPVEPSPPTYTMGGVGGATEERDHNQESIDDPKTSEAEREAWMVYLAQKAAYDARMAEIEARINEMRGTFINLEGIKVRGLPADLPAWADKQRARYGFEIDGTDDESLLLAFISHNVIRTMRDGVRITAGILRASGLDQEALDAAEASFLDTLDGRQGGGDDSGDQGVSGEGEPENE